MVGNIALKLAFWRRFALILRYSNEKDLEELRKIFTKDILEKMRSGLPEEILKGHRILRPYLKYIT